MSRYWLILALLCGLPARAQSPNPSSSSTLEEIPIGHCDRLPVLKVHIDNAEMQFLVDSGATTFLNVKSFEHGRSSQIKIHSWTGEAATSAREVSIPVLRVGTHELHDLKLPAIDLNPIGKACGGQIDGLFGVDLMEKMGLKIDFERQLASFQTSPDDVRKIFDEMEAAMHPCTVAFEQGKAKEFADCLDPDIVLYTPHGEFNGREQVLEYMRQRYFKFAPHLSYDATLHEAKIYGDALWYSYDYFLDTPGHHMVGHGMSMCRKSGGRWRILNMHQSLYAQDAKSVGN
jgi:hypothetical protein